jgi:ABC-type phosphate transport system substrate-binding protein
VGLRRRRFIKASGVVLAGALWHRPLVLAADGTDLAVITHPDLGISSLDQSTLAAIFLRDLRVWQNKVPLRPLNLPPRSVDRVAFDRAALNLDPDRSAQFWIDKMIRGEATPPRQITNAALLRRVVEVVPGAIGYVPVKLVQADAKVKTVAFIRGGKVVKT